MGTGYDTQGWLGYRVISRNPSQVSTADLQGQNSPRGTVADHCRL